VVDCGEGTVGAFVDALPLIVVVFAVKVILAVGANECIVGHTSTAVVIKRAVTGCARAVARTTCARRQLLIKPC
jgi:hypothetical protein